MTHTDDPAVPTDGPDEPDEPDGWDDPVVPGFEAADAGTDTGVDDDPAAGGGRRLPLVLAAVATVLVFAAALLAPLLDHALRGEEEAQRALDLSLVDVVEIEDRHHTMDDVTYPQDPPLGGPHAPVWLDCGVYDEPVREENAVHDLEHGTIWITHDPALSGDDVERLAAELPDNGIMSPREGLPSPVVVTVWGAQLRLDGADDPRLELFLEEYADGHTSPEFGASCHGGTPDPQGGLPGEGVDT